jgi:two-component sensor histidine kinase
VISLSAKSAQTTDEFAQKILGRLEALALAHELILPEKSKHVEASTQPTSLDNLVQKILAPYIDSNNASAENRRIVMSGPQIAVGPRAATNVALILHEFATNAAKYGALSVPAGRVQIEWSERDDQLVLNWHEQSGPAVDRPTTSGFGTLLSDLTIRGQFGGKLAYHWKPDGLVIDLSCPIERLSA